MSKFTKEHYEMIAEILKNSELVDDEKLLENKHYMPYTIQDQWLSIRDCLVTLFKNDNPKFNEEKFLKACESKEVRRRGE